MNGWTVIIDDYCGTVKAYYVEADTPNQAAAFAARVYDAHTSIGGRVQHVFSGRVEFNTTEYAQTPPEIINLMITSTEKTIV